MLLNTSANGGKSFGEALKNGVIKIYGGTRPTNADASIGAATLLGTVSLNGSTFTPGSPTYGLNFAAAANRSIDKVTADVWQFAGLANGTATWFRYVGNAADDTAASTSLPRVDGTIAAFGGDVTLSNTTIVTANIYTFNQCLLAWPA